MKASKKRGFTIIELVIVIAVIAILAAVLIPTFANIIQKANVANDVALARNMNTILIADEATNGRSTDMYDVLIALEQGGFKLENLNPRADGNVFAWDKANNQIVYLDKKNPEKPIFQAKEIGNNKGDLYITTRKAEVFADYPGYSYYFASDISGNITLDEGSCLDTGEFALNGNVSVKTNKDVEIHGTINGTITVDSTSGKITNYSVVENVVIKNTAATSYHERGHVAAMEIQNSLTGKVVLENDAYVEKLTNNKTNGTVESKGYVKAVAAESSDKESVKVTETGYVLEIGTYDQLVNFRNKVNAGASYSGMTVKLTADIDISERAWTPIGAVHREGITTSSKVFQGTFDGEGHTISGLTNTGFKISSAFKGSNGTTPAGYGEYVFGLFGSVYNATIKNIVMANVNVDLGCDEKEKVVGDSVGAIVGYAAGTNVTIDSCKVLSGSIVGYDAVAGIIGRTYSANTTISNCENAATVTAIRRASGILGFASLQKGATSVAITGCKNSGNVKQTGTPTTDPADKTQKGYGYYMVAGLAIYQRGTSLEKVITITGSSNTGTVTLTVPAGEGKNKDNTVWYY